MSICWRCSNFTNFPIMVDHHYIFQVVKAGTMLGLSLGKLQLGSRREKVLQEEEKVKFELYKIRSWHWEWESILLGRGRLWSSLGKRSSGHKQITCQALALALYLHNLSFLIQILAKTLEPVKKPPKPLNPCCRCDLDFVYQSLLNHHLRSVHDEKLSDKRDIMLQCDSCQFSAPKLAFLKTHNKFLE